MLYSRENHRDSLVRLSEGDASGGCLECLTVKIKKGIMAREALDYIQEELEVINKRLKSFFEFGYSPEVLGPLVDVMCEYKRKLEELEKQE